MKKILIGLTIALAATAASAGCTASDSWKGPDKTKHAITGAVVGSVGTLVFKDAKNGFLAGVAVAAAKEAYDATGKGTCSFQDFAVTAGAAYAAAYGTAWIITPRYVGVSVRF